MFLSTTECFSLADYVHSQVVAQRLARPRPEIGGSNSPLQFVLLQEASGQGVSIIPPFSETVCSCPALTHTSKQAGYESVRKWTSRVDIFSKKYLVVPINEQ